MHTWKTGAIIHLATISALLLCVSCGPSEQGYWIKQGMSQAQTDEQFATDSPHCERYAAQNEGRDSEKARQKRYTKCMSARDYQWVVREQPGALPEPSRQSTAPLPCPVGSPNCTPVSTTGGGSNSDVNPLMSWKEHPRQNPADDLPDPSHQSDEQRRMNDWECRQQAEATLSSPYGVYASCMQEKMSASPGKKAGADPTEHDNIQPNKSPTQDPIGVEPAPRNSAEERPTIGLTSGQTSSAASAQRETSDPDLAQEIGLGVQNVAGNIGSGFSKIGSALGRPLEALGRGLQNVFRNIGEEITKIGSRIGTLFKHLGGNDTRDKNKEREPNKLIAAPPEGDIG